jgi:hypothetical protein
MLYFSSLGSVFHRLYREALGAMGVSESLGFSMPLTPSWAWMHSFLHSGIA